MPNLKPKVQNLSGDPSNIVGRLYDAIDMALYDINVPGVSPKERLSAIIAIGRICVILQSLHKDATDDSIIPTGSKVRSYEKLFTNKNAAGRRAVRTRTQPNLLRRLDDAADLDDGDDGDGLEADG